ncbi:elongation factor G [Nitratireductor aquimarinus]|uniref:elongation factor G n=1 Tax=Alphaproteobacteria TaxID=28211 RepID=UPI0019D36660|nr:MULTISPECIES: elongation factor G [Alphaproteobacteria]MBN7757534.1 elongation factor G [Nitratireductor aquimarinus]MBY6000294.1 elongation factor G [Tritonibacter mobilis]MBY6022324.1 elongation factor G [Nitratireductor sp. DP7N14-4]MCV0380176.1 elongation factor G [Nitratireductor sp.]
MGTRSGERSRGPKCIAIVGPFASGKTTLLEAILERTGAIMKQAATGSGATVGDHSAEAREHQMSVEASIATTEFLGESMTFVDCPGSIEFAHEADPVLAAADMAIVVTEPDEKKIAALQLTLHRLDELGIPRMIFLNKIEHATLGVRDMLKMLQPTSDTPLMLRQIPLRKDGIVIGSIDLALERAYIYREHASSEIAPIDDDDRAREVEARFSMLETLADHDDKLMEQLLEEIEPPRDAIFDDLAADLRDGSVTPVLIGSAEKGNGILRLLKSIRHDSPDIEATRERLGLQETGDTVLQVMKTIHTPHGGKLSVSRVLCGTLTDGTEVRNEKASDKVSGIYTLLGREQNKVASAQAGETVALGKLDDVRTGDTLTTGKTPIAPLIALEPPQPVYSMAVRPGDRKDEAKLSLGLQKLAEEDSALGLEQRQETGETVLCGQGEMHLRVTRERLEGKYQVPITTAPPSVAYRETIRKNTTQRGRHKKQSGGHGQFGDVVLDIRPLPRGSGFEFTDTITGGVVPKQYIPSVEAGVVDYLKCGPLGFPVIDVAVNLADGSYHSVDSSDMAFQLAGRLAMKEGLGDCSPVLLEPILKVEVHTPSDATARVTAILSQRRGQILGFDARPGWNGWDVVEAMIPASETGDLIIELRSATAGVAGYRASFDHMAELTGRLADAAMNAQGKAA